MYIFTLESTQSGVTPWGAEVQRRLWEQEISQDMLCSRLCSEGFSINNVQFSRLLRGSTRGKLPVILAINGILGIPCNNFTDKGGKAQDGSCIKGRR